MTQEPGQQLLHYRLVEEIGAGGMGTVWKAIDTTLAREAAIKILPEALAEDELFLARFQREARLLASLSHPNLASVFGVHESHGTRFLAMELVPGEDLSQRLRRGRLPLREALPILRQIAEALEAAHEKGVIHRDLKPANVRVMPDGRVKVLDFGLARPADDEAAASAGEPFAALTSTGVMLGTPPYMSPEQVRGRRVDTCTDLWSFGCVVWECITGQRPFRAATVPELLTAILHDEPNWRSLPPDTPVSLRRLLRRCLSKESRDRLHHAADARIELEESSRELDGTAIVVDRDAPAATRLRFVWHGPGSAAAVALGVVAGLFLRQDDAPRPSALAGASFRQLTNYPGDELGATISPDGNFVAFLADRRGEFEVFAGGIGDEYDNVSESSGVGPISWPMIRVRRIGFLGDGRGLWLGGGPGHKATKLELVGRGVADWLQEGVIHVDWSPDGERIVYSHSTMGDPIFIANANGTDPREVPLPDEGDLYHQHFPTWSTDGRWLYVCRGVVQTDRIDLWRCRPDGTGLERLTEGLRDVQHPVSVDERTVLFIAREPDGAGPWLFELDIETREARRAHHGLGRFTSLSGSRGARRLVATVVDPDWSLWMVPILPDREATEADVKPHPLPAARALAPRIHEDQLYYLSSEGDGDGLWVYHDGKGRRIWDGDEMALLEPAAVSPDGARIALNVREGARGRLWVIKADGTDPVQLMPDVDIVGTACWSPEGGEIAVGGMEGGRRGLFKVRLPDGHGERLYQGDAINPVWSPDGRTIVFEGPHVAANAMLRAVTPEGRRIEFFDQVGVRPFGERLRFLPDGSCLVYLTGVNPKLEFHLLDTSSGGSRRLTNLDDAVMRTFDVTPDGKTIVFDRQRINADIVLIERAIE